MTFSRAKKLNLENIKKEKRTEGVYILLNRLKNEIYIGSSTQLRHRLKAVHYGRADYAQVDGKMSLSYKAKYYKTQYTNISRARRIEKNKKKNLRFNKL